MVGRRDCLLSPSLDRRPEHEGRAAESKYVAVEQAPATDDPFSVDERAVSREPVVHKDPILVESSQLGMDPRNLGIEFKAYVGSLAATDAEAVGAEFTDDLTASAIPVDRERRSTTLCLNPLLQLARRLCRNRGWHQPGA
jgi:hypothetical protein